jgi:NAD(P)-dependent dehydrogenase (short-subunit alcohol dehydrogenase family)
MATAASAVPGGSVDLALEGGTVIVTGAGSGIGAATARLLGAAGASVVLVGRRAAPLRQNADAVEQAGGRAVPVPADLADRTSPARIIAAALAAFGRIDGLVNNAAMCQHRPLPEWGADEFDEQVATNIRAPYFLIQAALRESAIKSVVNISSSSGTLRISGQSVYGMTKSALEYLTQSPAGAEVIPHA